MRGWAALALALPLLATAPAAHATSTPQAAPVVPSARTALPLFDAIDRIPVAEEHREGYKRDLYKHWNRGLLSDGCDTRKEVILSEAVVAPEAAPGCKLTGGSWRSAYDGVLITDAARLDVDHFVPLAEVYDSK